MGNGCLADASKAAVRVDWGSHYKRSEGFLFHMDQKLVHDGGKAFQLPAAVIAVEGDVIGAVGDILIAIAL